MESESGPKDGNTLSHQAVAKWPSGWYFWPEWQVASVYRIVVDLLQLSLLVVVLGCWLLFSHARGMKIKLQHGLLGSHLLAKGVSTMTGALLSDVFYACPYCRVKNEGKDQNNALHALGCTS